MENYVRVIPSGKHITRGLLSASRNLRVGALILLDLGKGMSLPLEGKVPRNEADEVFYPCEKT